MLRKQIITTTTLLLLLFIGVIPVSAQIVRPEQLAIDTSTIQDDSSYSVPSSITVVPIFAGANDFNEADSDWYRGLFYYLVGSERRPGFTDIPFHYVVSDKGTIFAGNSGGEERTIKVDGLKSNSLVIGYLAGKKDNTFSPRSVDAIGNLIIELANRHEIKLKNVEVGGIRYEIDAEAQEISLTKQDLFGLWDTGLINIMDKIKSRYKPVAKKYTLEVVSVELPDTKVDPFESILGKITIKNTGSFGIYQETSSDIVATKRGGNSRFQDDKFWLSQSQFGLLPEGTNLLPGEEKTLDFRLLVPIEFGKLKENFDIRNITGTKLGGTDFSITLDIARPEGIIIEIAETETGWLRVRKSDSGAAEEIARVSTGDRYFQIDDAQNGWIRIKLTDGTKGWVSRQYLIYL